MMEKHDRVFLKSLPTLPVLIFPARLVLALIQIPHLILLFVNGAVILPVKMC
jgi:hypothetical protein